MLHITRQEEPHTLCLRFKYEPASVVGGHLGSGFSGSHHSQVLLTCLSLGGRGGAPSQLPVLVYYNIAPWPSGLETTEMYFLWFWRLEGQNHSAKIGQILVLVLFWVAGCQLVMFSNGREQCREAVRGKQSHSQWLCLPGFIYSELSCKDPQLLKPSHWKLGFQHMNVGVGCTNIQPIILLEFQKQDGYCHTT